MPTLSMFPACVAAVVLFAFPAVCDVIFEDPRPLHPSMLSDDLSDVEPQIATDGQGNWVAVWTQPASLLSSFSHDNGETWSAPALVHPATTGVRISPLSLNIAANGVGRWLLAVSIRDVGLKVTRSEDNGLSWSTPLLIEQEHPVPPWLTTEGRALYPYLATDGDGTCVVMWQSRYFLTTTSSLTGHKISMSRSLDHGVTWSTPVDMDPAQVIRGSTSSWPRIVYDGAGHWVAVWDSWSKREDHPEYGGDRDIMVSRSTDNWATWTPPTALNTDAATDSNGSPDSAPDLATDGRGNWLAVWNANTRLKVSRSTDNGATWSDPEFLPSPPFPDPFTVSHVWADLATDGQGEWIITWSPRANADVGNYFVQRVIWQMFSQDNGRTWSEPTPMYTVDAGNVWIPVFVTHDGSNAFLAIWWAAQEDVEGDIFIARGKNPLDTDVLDHIESDSSDTCFIATAAYGTPMASEINSLRAVRDSYLLNNAVGTAFVDTYYRFSPPVAEFIAQYPALRLCVRVVLSPIVYLSKITLASPLSGGLMLLAVSLAITRLCRKFRQARVRS